MSRGIACGCVTVLLLVFAACSQGPKEQSQEEWISLFNGRDLAGWTPKFAGYEAGVNYKDTFRVEDGILKVGYENYEAFNGEFGHLFYNQSFSHYRLRIEYRFTGEQTPGGPSWGFRNSGAMLHGQIPESMTVDQRFPVSIEVQFLGGGGQDERPTANLCTPGTHVEMAGELVTQHCTNSGSATFHGDQWVTVEVEVRGDEMIRHFVNGEQVLEYQKPQLDSGDAEAQKLIEAGAEMKLSEGTISVQAESHPLEFRRIELLPLR
jgi:hypothetical protein